MDMKKKIYIIILLLILAFMLGCARTPVLVNRSSAATNIANKANFIKEYIKAGDFTLLTYQRFKKSRDSIRIYIEGDGRAWETKYRLSDDPTPSNPVALRLAAADSSDNVAYIARPGQFPALDSVECNPTYWSARRFASEVVEAFDKTIDILKEKTGAKHIELVGYSGGGAITILVAARRRDITALRTVAGNLDPQALCSYHKVSQLNESMNPLDCAQKVAHIPQRHFIGSNDKVVPVLIARSFVGRLGDRDDKRITIVNGVNHANGWQEKWPELLVMQIN